MEKFKSKEAREAKINQLKAKYLENNKIVTEEFVKVFDSIVNYSLPQEERTNESLLAAFRNGTIVRQKYKSRFRMSDQQVDEHISWFKPKLDKEERLSFEEFKEMANRNPWEFKMATATNGAYPNRNEIDIPEEKMLQIYTTIYI